MKPTIRRTAHLLAVLLCFIAGRPLRAGDNTVGASTITTPDTRYGLFGLLDHRSSYGQDVFPEPFLVDDSDLEENELQLDWFHAKAGSARSDVATSELEKGFGLLTLELEVPYVRDASPDGIERGVGNISIGARHSVFQYVSPSGFFDTTFGMAAEVGIPTTSPVSKNTEFVPKIFNDMRFGSRITLQSICGYSMLFGPGEDSGLHTFEYGFVLGITFQHKELPVPGVQQIIPMFEISGEKQLNHDDAHNSVLADVGFRVNFKPLGAIQPRIGVSYVFPMNQVARGEVHQGIYTSLVFEF